MEQEKKLEELVRPSSLIELKDIPGKGRGFVATQDLKVGDILFTEDPIRSPPYASANGLPPKEATNALAKKIKEVSCHLI